MIRTHEQQVFLRSVQAGLAERVEVATSGSAIWRAAIGHDWRHEEDIGEEVPACYGPERLKPRTDRASEGRVNVKGMPVFYGATHSETAIAEVRPWIGSYVSVGQFRILRELRIVNLVTDRSLLGRIWIGSEPQDDVKQEYVWQTIDAAFSEPSDRSDDTADYAPTQVIAEFIRAAGYDGLAYGSALGPGHNIALFDLSAASQVTGHLYQVKHMKITAAECDNPYGTRRGD